MRPLPVPAEGETIETLHAFLNAAEEGDFCLMVAWVVGALRPQGPYPVLSIGGPQGAAKSTTSRVLRRLVDPNASPLRTLSRDDRDLFVASHNAYCIAFDNVSGLPAWLADGLCRLATGGGFATR